MISLQREKRGVLVYVDDAMMKEVEVIDDYKKVTESTPDEELRAMGKKTHNRYPVFLIGKKYGKRGLDYRSFENLLGLCLIIAASCSSIREFI